jgi:hypothetical protein
MGDKIKELLIKLDNIKSELYDVKFNDYQKDSKFSYSIDKIDTLIKHLKDFE